MADSYEISIGEKKRQIDVCETQSRELAINGSFYIVPVGVVNFIKEMAGEIEDQQKRKVATDQMIDEKINKRVDRMIKELSRRGLLAKPLDADYPLPDNVETSGGPWKFMDEARIAAREGLKNEWRDDLVDDIGSPYTSPPRKK